MEGGEFICHACKKPTLGQRFCPNPGCGTLQKEARISGVVASPKKAAKGASGVVPPKQTFTVSKEKVAEEWAKVVKLSVDEQAMVFLRAFVVEFAGGKFEEVLQLAEQFKSFKEKEDQIALDQFQALRFLETRKEAKTASELRATLGFIDVNHKSGDLHFLEFLLFHYRKQVAALFDDSGNSQNAELIRKLEEAIENYRRVFREKKEREEKKEELRAKAAAGDVKAKAELKRMELQDDGAASASAADEALSIQKKLAAKRALANPESDKERLLEEEKKRVEEEKKRQEAEEKRKREESRKKLADKAKLWN